MTYRNILFSTLCTGVLALSGIGSAHAAFIDFENQTPGDPITRILSGGVEVSFSSNVTTLGLDLITSNSALTGNATTSGSQYLGVNDNSSELFLGGDRIDLQFSQPIDEFFVSFITGSNTAANVLEISNGIDSVFNAQPTDFLGLDEVFTFGLSGGSAFSQVSLSAAAGSLVAFNIDDVQFNPISTVPVPAPSAFVLMLTGFCSYLFCLLFKQESSKQKPGRLQFQPAV